MNSQLTSKLINTVIFLALLSLYLLTNFYMFDPSLSQPFKNFISEASTPWILYTLATFAYGLIAKGWNNIRIIRAYVVLNTLSVFIYFYIGITHGSNFSIRVLCFGLSSSCFFIYFRYRHIFILLYTRWLIKSKSAQRRELTRKIQSLAKVTVLEVFLYYFTLFAFLTDLLMTLYLAIYQNIYLIKGSITQHIIENEHLNIFNYHEAIQYYGSFIALVFFLFLIVLEIRHPDASGRKIELQNYSKNLLKLKNLKKIKG